jgi:hypothetical protein
MCTSHLENSQIRHQNQQLPASQGHVTGHARPQKKSGQSRPGSAKAQARLSGYVAPKPQPAAMPAAAVAAAAANPYLAAQMQMYLQAAAQQLQQQQQGLPQPLNGYHHLPPGQLPGPPAGAGLVYPQQLAAAAAAYAAAAAAGAKRAAGDQACTPSSAKKPKA